MSRPVLGIGAGLLSGTGSDRTEADVTGGSCVTDSMAQTYRGVGVQADVVETVSSSGTPCKKYFNRMLAKRSGIVPRGDLATEGKGHRGNGKGGGWISHV